jgi:hypothetical protein
VNLKERGGRGAHTKSLVPRGNEKGFRWSLDLHGRPSPPVLGVGTGFELPATSAFWRGRGQAIEQNPLAAPVRPAGQGRVLRGEWFAVVIAEQHVLLIGPSSLGEGEAYRQGDSAAETMESLDLQREEWPSPIVPGGSGRFQGRILIVAGQ